MPKRKPENKMIEVIMLEFNKHLGEKFEIVKVKPVYARNVLLPKNMAVLADPVNINKFAQKMKAAEHERKNKATGYEDLFAKINNDGWVKIIRRANKDHTLYAKVDENDIISAIKEIYGIEVEPHLLKLKKKLTSVGSFNVPFLYKEIKRDVPVVIEADPEEEKKHKKSEDKTVAEKKEEKEEIRKSKEELKAERDEKRKVEKVEKLKQLKAKYK